MKKTGPGEIPVFFYYEIRNILVLIIWKTSEEEI
jgi:hypothetical protein